MSEEKEIVKGFMTGEMSEYGADIFSLVTESDKNVRRCGVVWQARPGLGLGVDYILPLKCSISSFNWRDKFHCVQGPTETESHTETSVIHYTHRTIIRIYLYQESRLHLLLIMNEIERSRKVMRGLKVLNVSE